MKKAVFLTSFFITMALCTSFSSGQAVVKETRNLTGFTKVNFGVAGELFIKFGPQFQVVLEGNKNYLDEIITEVSGGRLVIKKENWRIGMNERVTVYITMPEIKGLGVSGSGKAEIEDALKSEALDLSVSGSGKLLTADLNVTDLNCGISGSGNINLGGNGNVSKADISISGSGNFFGDSVKIEDLHISVSGSGNCSCNVTGSLDASISGSGNVTYSGSPRLNARVSGSGHVRSR